MELETDVIAALKQGHKIEAIKRLRGHRGIGLKEAKDLVDHYCAEHDIHPSVEKVSGGSGIVGLLLLAVIGYFLYRQFG